MEGIWDGKCLYQCDQLVRLIIHYLAIYNI